VISHNYFTSFVIQLFVTKIRILKLIYLVKTMDLGIENLIIDSKIAHSLI